MNTSPLRLAESDPAIITLDDRDDALRVIEAAVTVAAIPGLMSPVALELAARRLRELATAHPRTAEILAAVVLHLESYQA